MKKVYDKVVESNLALSILLNELYIVSRVKEEKFHFQTNPNIFYYKIRAYMKRFF